MAILKGHRFPIEFADAFPQGLVLMGELAPDNEYQSREDRAAGRLVPTTAEVLPGMRKIELEGVTAEPWLAGNGEFKYQSYVFGATGFRSVGTAGKPRPAGKPGSESASKAA